MNKEEKLNEYLDKIIDGDIEGLNIVLSISKEDGSNDVVLIAGRESVIRAMYRYLVIKLMKQLQRLESQTK